MSEPIAKRGLFISLEGMDGSGKSQGIDHFCARLKKEGVDIIRTREIGGTEFGEKIRALCFQSSKPVDPTARLLALLATRAQHLKEVIIPALERGVTVVSDRYIDSTYVYQGVVDNLEYTYHELISTLSLGFLSKRSNLTIFFKVDPEVAFTRGAARTNLDNDQYKQNLEMARRIAQGYELLYEELPPEQKNTIYTVDSNASIEEVNTRLAQLAVMVKLMA